MIKALAYGFSADRTMDPGEFPFTDGSFYLNEAQPFAEECSILWPPDIVDLFGESSVAGPAETLAPQTLSAFNSNQHEPVGDIIASFDIPEQPELTTVNIPTNGKTAQGSTVGKVHSMVEPRLRPSDSSRITLHQPSMKVGPPTKSGVELRACWRCKILKKRVESSQYVFSNLLILDSATRKLPARIAQHMIQPLSMIIGECLVAIGVR